MIKPRLPSKECHGKDRALENDETFGADISARKYVDHMWTADPRDRFACGGERVGYAHPVDGQCNPAIEPKVSRVIGFDGAHAGERGADHIASGQLNTAQLLPLGLSPSASKFHHALSAARCAHRVAAQLQRRRS